jgi:triosephosphate isomerase
LLYRSVLYAIPPLGNEARYGIALEPVQMIGRDAWDWKAYQQATPGAASATISQCLTALSCSLA